MSIFKFLNYMPTRDQDFWMGTRGQELSYYYYYYYYCYY